MVFCSTFDFSFFPLFIIFDFIKTVFPYSVLINFLRVFFVLLCNLILYIIVVFLLLFITTCFGKIVDINSILAVLIVHFR